MFARSSYEEISLDPSR